MSLGAANKFHMSLFPSLRQGWLVRPVQHSIHVHLLGQMAEHKLFHSLGQMPEHNFHLLGQMQNTTATPSHQMQREIKSTAKE
jgi:hypothetical protein